MAERVRLSDLVQAYADREEARNRHYIAMRQDDRTDIVGEEEARRVRRELVQTGVDQSKAEAKVERLLRQAYDEALAREAEENV